MLTAQLLIQGLITASFYALAGVTWGIIYRTTLTFHFSHQLVFTVAGYTAALLTAEFKLHFLFAFFFSIAAAVALGCAIDAFLYRRLREMGATKATTFLSSLGFATAGVAMLLSFQLQPEIAERLPREDPLPRLSSSRRRIWPWSWSPARRRAAPSVPGQVPVREGHSGRGKQPRHGLQLGLDINRVYLLVYAIGRVFGVAAFLFTAKNVAYPTMGIFPFFMSFTAVFLGGIQYSGTPCRLRFGVGGESRHGLPARRIQDDDRLRHSVRGDRDQARRTPGFQTRIAAMDYVYHILILVCTRF